MCVKYIIALKACYGSFLSGGMWHMQYDVSELADKILLPVPDQLWSWKLQSSYHWRILLIWWQDHVTIGELLDRAGMKALSDELKKDDGKWLGTSWDKTKTATTK